MARTKTVDPKFSNIYDVKRQGFFMTYVLEITE